MSHASIQAVIFDLGGVVLDWDPRHVYRRYFATSEQIESFLKEIDFADWNSQQDRGRTFAEGVAALSAVYPHRAALIRAYFENWGDSVTGPIDGTVEIARSLKSAGYPLYALSNWSAETFPIARQRYDCLELFDAILISGEVGIAKPDPRIFDLMLRKIDLPASACLLIDDSPQNVRAAEALGFKAILFRSADSLAERLVELRLLKSNWREI